MSNRPATVERRRTLFEEALEIIERDYARDLELEGVARMIATSRRQLQRSFSEAGATSFRDTLTAVRMRRALELLRDGPLPVRDVAAAVGYRQPAQFAKALRRHYGQTPSDLRRRAIAARRARAGRPPVFGQPVPAPAGNREPLAA